VKLLFSMLVIICAAAPATAHYGDTDLQIEAVKLEAISTHVALAEPNRFDAKAGTCPLSQDHLVIVPTTFDQEADLQMACVAE